jgi:aminopeptidase 2
VPKPPADFVGRECFADDFFSIVNRIVAEAHRRFKLFVENDESALHPNIRSTVYEIVLLHGGGEKEYNDIVEIYRKCQTADQKTLILTTLGFVQQPELIKRALDFSLSDEVRNQDIIWVFQG